MNVPNNKWDRQELYERVWQLPLRTLAAEYGVSDVALGKVCRKLQIPLPGLGHWTKLECGHVIPRPPLPEVHDLPVLLRQVREQPTPILPEDAAIVEKVEQLEETTIPPITKA